MKCKKETLFVADVEKLEKLDEEKKFNQTTSRAGF